MIAAPLVAGAVHETTELTLALDVAVTDVGAPGAAAGMAAAEVVEYALDPLMLVAKTWKT